MYLLFVTYVYGGVMVDSGCDVFNVESVPQNDPEH